MADDLPEARDTVCPTCNGVGAVPARTVVGLAAREEDARRATQTLDTVLRLVLPALHTIETARSTRIAAQAADQLEETLSRLGFRGLDYIDA